jgi:hypothetical protein
MPAPLAERWFVQFLATLLHPERRASVEAVLSVLLLKMVRTDRQFARVIGRAIAEAEEAVEGGAG